MTMYLFTIYNEPEEELNEDSPPSIIVTGFPERSDEDDIRMCFENKRKFRIFLQTSFASWGRLRWRFCIYFVRGGIPANRRVKRSRFKMGDIPSLLKR